MVEADAVTVRLAIDPGPERSAWLVHNTATGGIRQYAISQNEWLLGQLRAGLSLDVSHVAIEKVESFGMAVGAEVFETVWWSGRFAEALHGLVLERVSRRAVKLHLCGSARAKDTNIRQALIDRYGGSAAIGKKAAPGPLYGVSKDVWSALAVAVTAADTLP
jgi:hypothetical protein